MKLETFFMLIAAFGLIAFIGIGLLVAATSGEVRESRAKAKAAHIDK